MRSRPQGQLRDVASLGLKTVVAGASLPSQRACDSWQQQLRGSSNKRVPGAGRLDTRLRRRSVLPDRCKAQTWTGGTGVPHRLSVSLPSLSRRCLSPPACAARPAELSSKRAGVLVGTATPRLIEGLKAEASAVQGMGRARVAAPLCGVARAPPSPATAGTRLFLCCCSLRLIHPVLASNSRSIRCLLVSYPVCVCVCVCAGVGHCEQQPRHPGRAHRPVRRQPARPRRPQEGAAARCAHGTAEGGGYCEGRGNAGASFWRGRSRRLQEGAAAR